MIKAILFVVFFIILAVTIGLIVFAGIKLYRKVEDGEDAKGAKGFLIGSIISFA